MFLSPRSGGCSLIVLIAPVVCALAPLDAAAQPPSNVAGPSNDAIAQPNSVIEMPPADFSFDTLPENIEDEDYRVWNLGSECCDECTGAYCSHTTDCSGECGWRWFDNLTAFGGAHGFKGPLDNGVNGNFGLGVGLNWGAPLVPAIGLGYQVGWQAVLSNFEGDRTLGDPRAEHREQHFITAGIFHRPSGRPIQGGLVFDWLHDDYYAEQNLSQIRGELSLLGAYRNEVGFWGAFSTSDDTATITTLLSHSDWSTWYLQWTERWEPIDQYAFFLRRRFAFGTEGRLWGGFTGRGDGLFGADMRAPVSRDLAIVAGFNYVAPGDENDQGFQAEESWGLVMNLVWSPARTAVKSTRSRWRPLFNVADNSTFMVDREVVDAKYIYEWHPPIVTSFRSFGIFGRWASASASSASAPNQAAGSAISYELVGPGSLLPIGTFTTSVGYLDAFVSQSPTSDNDALDSSAIHGRFAASSSQSAAIFGRFWDGDRDGVLDPTNLADIRNPPDYDLRDLARFPLDEDFTMSRSRNRPFVGPQHTANNLYLLPPGIDNPEDVVWVD